MEFRTTLRLEPSRRRLRHSDELMLIGSCFSDSIGAKLRGAMMLADVNPTGTVYNPLSIAATIDRIIDNTPVAGMDLFQQGGVWAHFDFHTRFSMPDKEATLQRMNRRIATAHDRLRTARALVLTLGTSVVYRLADTGRVVANCHKVAPARFSREMASQREIVGALNGMLGRLNEFNPGLDVIFTVSPIRHIADGLDRNSLSKAQLRVAIDTVAAGNAQVSYFPAYEIMLDDLRDYRFYAADMLHPSEVAVEYIWQAFQATYFDDRSAQAIARCERVAKRLAHRPIAASRETQDRFNADTRTVARNLLKEYPYLSRIKEISQLLDL